MMSRLILRAKARAEGDDTIITPALRLGLLKTMLLWASALTACLHLYGQKQVPHTGMQQVNNLD